MNIRERLKELSRYRELLLNLTRKEIKVKYKNSFFGFLWSLINPLAMLVIFYVAFGVIFKLRSAGMQYYAFFLMSGILPWNFLSNSLAQAVGSIVNNGVLVKKVYFPREVLPLSYMGSAGFHFLLQMAVLLVFLIAFRVPLTPWIFAFPLVMALEVLFIAGMVLWLSALNVFFRDIQHFTEILLMGWFWMTPIVYPVSNMLNTLPRWAERLYLLNPMAHIVLLYQYIVYNAAHNAPGGVDEAGVVIPSAVYVNFWAIAGVTVGSLFLVATGYLYLTRREGKFAEFV